MPNALLSRRTAPSRHGGPVRPATISIGRATALGLGTGAVLLTIWAGSSTWFIVARDDLAQRVFVRETEMRYGYEDRIKALQTELERAVTQHAVEREGFAARLDGVAKRQSDLESRQAWLARLADRVPSPSAGNRPETGLSEGSARAISPLPANAYAPPPAPQPMPEPFALRLREPVGAPERPPPRERLSVIERSLETAASTEFGILDRLRRNAQARLSRVRIALGSAGLDVDRIGSGRGVGGPLVALPESGRLPIAAGAFGPLAAEVESTFDELDRTIALARSLPLARPLGGDLEATSPFGYRMDPFTRTPALHTGADFRAEAGSAVRATGAGRVTIAEYTGGYGNMVEIDHGGGLATRYGHLSAFSVGAGERVESGELVGRVGSTGRSTGSHLHYETRINGEPVNPLRFLEAGTLLAGVLDPARSDPGQGRTRP